MRTMALDVGTKTVGVAVSDELGLTAQGLTTVWRQNLRMDLAELGRLIREHEVGRVVVGLPLNMNGSEGPRALAARQFAALLGEATGLPVELWDERLSTVEAQRVLLEADMSRAKRRQVVDQVAATLILEGWLLAQKPSALDGDDDWEEP